MRSQALVIASALFLGACASGPSIQTGPDAEMTHDGLVRVDNTAMQLVWVRPGADLSGYDKVMLPGVGIEFRPVTRSANEYDIPEDARERLRGIFRDAFQESLGDSDRFQLVTERGPGTLLVYGGLTDVVSRNPGDPGGRDAVWIREIGEATIVLEVRDSETEAILARAADRRIAENMSGNLSSTNRVTTQTEVRRLANTWASQLRRGLERLMDAGPLGGG